MAHAYSEMYLEDAMRTLGEAVDVGTGACFRPRVSVGANAVIGAGAAVVHDLPGNCVAVGAPARPTRP